MNEWISVEEKPTPDFDGDYLCEVQIKQECGNIWTRCKVRQCVMNNWVLFDNEVIVSWQPLPPLSLFINHN